MSRKKNPDAFISIRDKKYATYCPSNRKHGGKDTYLGTVVDGHEGIFYNNRNGGYFRFTLETGRTELTQEQIDYYMITDKPSNIDALRCARSLDFGDAWFVDEILTSSGLKNVFSEAYPEDPETLISLIAFKLLRGVACHRAQTWQTGSYNRVLYPGARLTSQRISEFMAKLGDEQNVQSFFSEYFYYLKNLPQTSYKCLIDSTGLKNDIHFPLAGVNTHNGVTNRETRLIFVVDRVSKLPIYFRCVRGNIVDVSTAHATFNELEAQGVSLNGCICDAGYWSESNIREYYARKATFLIRMPAKLTEFSKIIREHSAGLPHNLENAVRYKDRIIWMKCVEQKMFGYDGYAYVCIDFEQNHLDEQEYLVEYLNHKAAQKKAKLKEDRETEKLEKEINLKTKKVIKELHPANDDDSEAIKSVVDACLRRMKSEEDAKKKEKKRSNNNLSEGLFSNDEMDALGHFILYSNEKLELEEVLPFYYQRQTVEQIFDYAKTDVDLLPLRTHNIETFRGYMLLAFLSTILYLFINYRLSETEYTAIDAFDHFQNLKCKVFNKVLTIEEGSPAVNAIAKQLKLKIPETIPLPEELK